MDITLVVTNVNLGIDSDTVKLRPQKTTSAKALMQPTTSSFLDIPVTDPALRGTFKPGQIVTVSIVVQTPAPTK